MQCGFIRVTLSRVSYINSPFCPLPLRELTIVECIWLLQLNIIDFITILSSVLLHLWGVKSPSKRPSNTFFIFSFWTLVPKSSFASHLYFYFLNFSLWFAGSLLGPDPSCLWCSRTRRSTWQWSFFACY